MTNLISAARTLGAGPWRVFARVAIPLAAGGLGAASALALARGLGEFGATIIFAGSLQGVDPDAAARDLCGAGRQDFDVALAISALFVVVGAAILALDSRSSHGPASTRSHRPDSAPSTSR